MLNPKLMTFLVSTSLVFTAVGAMGVVAADNSGVNLRDRSSSELTADQQGNAPKDVAAIRKIRQLIMKDKTMSAYAQNIKIISLNGLVTLKGPLKSQAEMQKVLANAKDVAGTANIIDELELVSEKM